MGHIFHRLDFTNPLLQKICGFSRENSTTQTAQTLTSSSQVVVRHFGAVCNPYLVDSTSVLNVGRVTFSVQTLGQALTLTVWPNLHVTRTASPLVGIGNNAKYSQICQD